jgi:NAD(P)H-quinone oxidoreductase subunit 5
MGSTLIVFFAAIGPAALLAAGLAPAGWAARHPARMGGLALGAAVLAVGGALLAALSLATGGAATASLPLFAVPGGAVVAASVYYDQVSAVMLLLVSFVGSIVVAYSRNYLAGDPGQGRFFRWLCLALAAVLLLVISGNLVQLAVAWVGMSLALHELLLFYPERPGAQLAARKKFIFSRLADACVIVAVILVARIFGTLELAGVMAGATVLQAAGEAPAGVAAVAVLLALAAIIKSAQLPFHSWLPQVMETPTPVSALLHAGIINAGGFLVVRLSDVVSLAPGALLMLAVFGAATALFGALVMLTQNSIKSSLAWSTIAQMGFMIMQCGLGAYAAALLHIVAHSLYKAHAFLSSGSVVELARARRLPHASVSTPGPLPLVGLGLVAAVAIAVAGGELAGFSFGNFPGVVALGAILLMSLAPLAAATVAGRRSAYVVVRCLGIGIAVVAAYFTLHLGFAELLAPAIAPRGAATAAGQLVAVAIMLGFAATVLLQVHVQQHRYEQPWRAFYVHLFNGFYLNLVANRVVEALWPLKTASSREIH